MKLKQKDDGKKYELQQKEVVCVAVYKKKEKKKYIEFVWIRRGSRNVGDREKKIKKQLKTK